MGGVKRAVREPAPSGAYVSAKLCAATASLFGSLSRLSAEDGTASAQTGEAAQPAPDF